ncbi:MAG: hypothetical protein KKB81_03860 [Candidatus Margulisbacteria bacterium]|nr:hypothetical protein [Candidatus Margulisiibacteriota bacterium]MBU1022018.1 hypothetical protein [Candidatus Margulisiibacteriota bacterium]MBU1729859.1 hypothetical protein [Candidatus Margulisiibacteriota bacterium]MBU1955189.1 hypothetical protein [Candidatus Margulisiibacteriota bacterium]
MKKVVIGLVILGLIIVIGVGMGKSFSLGHVPSETDQTSIAEESNQETVAKLVYVSTNETLSETLYHLDLQDGKLDEPHIVVTNLENDEEGLTTKGMVIKRKIRFIGKDGKIKRELLIEDLTKVSLENNFSAVRIVGLSESGPVYERYYDVEGNLFIDNKSFYALFSFSPNGQYYIRWKNMYQQPIEKLEFFDITGKLKGYYKYDTSQGHFNQLIFSKNGKFVLAEFHRGSEKSQPELFIFDHAGSLISRVDLSNFYITKDYEGMFISNNGEDVYLCGFNKDEKKREDLEFMSILVVDKNNQIKFKRTSPYYYGINMTPDGNYLVAATEDCVHVFDVEDNFREEKMNVEIYKEGIKSLSNIYMIDKKRVLLFQQVVQYEMKILSREKVQSYNLGKTKYFILGFGGKSGWFDFERTYPNISIYCLENLR